MESVVFRDSPLAQYLEGEGEAENENIATGVTSEPTSPQEVFSFAPTTSTIRTSGQRRRPPRLLNLDVSANKGAVAQIHERCSVSNFCRPVGPNTRTYTDLSPIMQSAVHGRLGWTKNANFLEQFRYIIVASQLLNEHTNSTTYKPQPWPLPAGDVTLKTEQETGVKPSPLGLSLTAMAALALAYSIKQMHRNSPTLSITTIGIMALLVALGATILYYYIRRQWLHYLRTRSVENATSLTTNAQNFDAAASAGFTLIQEVELVSRGYNIGSPLPPISRIEDHSQKRCIRLRRTMRRSLDSMFAPYHQAYELLRPHAVELDLEKYFDIYEISHRDLQDADIIATADLSEVENADSLQDLKIGLQKLHMIRKIFLCALLALNADGGKVDFQRWSAASEAMGTLSSLVSKMVFNMDEVLGEEEEFQVPPTPRVPLTPNRERMRGQMRKLGNLSQGIRGLQAKMRLLRDESDKFLEESDDGSESRNNLLAQYDSIGQDLRDLMHEWEQGRAALATTFAHGHSRSVSSTGISHSRSPTSSLGGSTAVGGSPHDAFQALNGQIHLPRSRSSTASSSGEEIFEAVAAPRQRSTLTREERLAKMKEDRVRLAVVQEKSNANTHLLRELETVIKLRPRGRTTGRLTMLEARLEQANLLKKVVDAIKDLVQDCNFDCNDSGVALQAMDNSHVALVSMMLKAESFSPFRCDRNIALGINLSSLMKVLRCAQNEDILTLKAEDAPDVVNLVFESSESDRLSEYDIKLMDIDQEHLGIPETEYAATITMPSAEFQRICRDLMALSESVSIEATKEGVKFACSGDIGNGAVTLRSHTNVEKPDLNVEIALTEPVSLTFSLKYLVNFCKASGLSSTVKLCLSNEVPLLVEYSLASNSYLRFYLAPKIGDDE